MKKYLLSKEGNFYKANLHCHSNYSDGKLSPQEIKRQYMEHGYSIVAYTDHDILIPHSELTDENFLALNGYEMEITEEKSPFFSAKTCHLCMIALEPDNLKQVCWHREKYLFGNATKYKELVQFYENEPDYERSYTPECISDMMKKGRDHGFFVTYNHPVWSMEEYNDYINYHNMHAMEICNYGCFNIGYGDYNPKIYDEMLHAGKRIFCIATDDNHNAAEPDSPHYDSFGGFTVINAEKLEYRTITKSLENGNFYASQGPEIEELWCEDGKLHIKCSPAARIDFNFGIRYAESTIAKKGETVNYACCELLEERIYVRVTVTDKEGRHANTNAYFIDELNK